METVLETSNSLRYETSQTTLNWVRGFALLIGLGTCALAYHVWTGDANHPWYINWFVTLLAAAFTLIPVFGNKWRAHCYFRADESGLHFPDKTMIGDDAQWLHVPWADVLRIDKRVRRDSDGSTERELVLELRISEATAKQYWLEQKKQYHFFSKHMTKDGVFKARYPHGRFKGRDIDEGVTLLCALQEKGKRYVHF